MLRKLLMVAGAGLVLVVLPWLLLLLYNHGMATGSARDGGAGVSRYGVVPQDDTGGDNAEPRPQQPGRGGNYSTTVTAEQ